MTLIMSTWRSVYINAPTVNSQKENNINAIVRQFSICRLYAGLDIFLPAAPVSAIVPCSIVFIPPFIFVDSCQSHNFFQYNALV